MEELVRIESDPENIRVFIRDTLHLSMRRGRLLGLQSWIYGKRGVYIIEFYMEGSKIKSEYADMNLWKSILNGLNEVLDNGS